MKASVRFVAARSCLTLLLLVSAAAAARAQDARAAAARLDRYEALASESVEVTLDGPLLKLAAAALSDKGPDRRELGELLRDVQGLYVRSLEFEKDGAYDPAELDALRAPFRGAGWSRVADVRSGKYEHVEVYVSLEGTTIRGLTVIGAGARELAFVNITGAIRPERISELEGRFSIPRMGLRIGGKE